MTIEELLNQARQGDATAKGELRARAQNGEAGAQWALGEMYAAGEGLPKNPDKAAECFRLAAEQGHEKARQALARMQGGGDGKFEALLDKAKQGDEQALEELLALLEDEEPPEEKVWGYYDAPEGEGTFGSERWNRVLDAFWEKAQEGDALAQYAVGCLFRAWGRIYEYTHSNADPERLDWYQESYDRFSEAAENGHAGAMGQLGSQYRLALGVEPDWEQAGYWLYRAARLGDRYAFLDLGELVQERWSDTVECGEDADEDVLDWLRFLAESDPEGDERKNEYVQRAKELLESLDTSEDDSEDDGDWTTPAPSPIAPPSGDTPTFTNSIGMEFLLIPAGTFWMGSADDDDDAEDDEKPRHEVTISRAFHLGKYPVTQKQWRAVMGENPSEFTGPDRPVENVSWEDAQEFIKRLNEAEGHDRYRLPTEAEWEYACRAGSETKYSFGDDADELGNYAWYDDNSGGKTHPVGRKQPNAWGLHDMHGNVCEWCEDWFGAYSAEAAVDPQGPGAGEDRVLRGGGWYASAGVCRAAYRVRSTPGSRYDFLGFRVARSPGH